MRDLKYLVAYIVPGLCYLSLTLNGMWTWLTVLFVFLIVPILEPLFTQNESNLSYDEIERKSKSIFFDLLLYINIPIVYGLLLVFIVQLKHYDHTVFELLGKITALGLTLGSAGINVAHELGHRNDPYHKMMSKILLTASLYNHFIIEHNLGYHKNVGTDLDPASAKRNQSLYHFWLTSVVYSYFNAWKIESKRLTRNDKHF